MKRFFTLCSLAAIVAAFTVSLLGGQVQAVSNGSNATQQYGAVSLWFPDSAGVNRHRCGASLISQFWAVTAAHCEGVLVPGQAQVKVGGKNNADPAQYQDVGLAQVIKHPDYTALSPDGQLVNDIALIKFQTPATIPTTKLALPLNSPPVGTQGKVAGWGWICDDQVPPAGPPNCGLPYTNILQELTLKVEPDSRCEFIGLADKELCVVAASGKHAMACRGDSGSPFVRNIAQLWVLMGIINGDGDFKIFHPNECDENINGEQGSAVLMDVSKYTGWIIDTIFHNLGNDRSATQKALQMPTVVKL